MALKLPLLATFLTVALLVLWCQHSRLWGAEVVLVGPPTFHVDDPSWFGCYQTSHFDEVIGDVDVVYMLRVQLERMEGAPIPSRREYNRLWGLDERRSKLMKPEAIICHPGPMNRGMEINSEVADCARSRILDQVNAGVFDAHGRNVSASGRRL